MTVPFGKGEAVLKIQNVYLVPGERARFDTAAENVSVEVTADGVTVSGDEQAPGGRRRLMQSVDGTASGASVGTTAGGDASANNFYKEGNTIKCPNAEVGEKGKVDGVTYTKVDRARLNVYDGLFVVTGMSMCTTDVTDMSYLFRDIKAFNAPIGNWDTSKVKDMNSMFLGATSFNQDISGWDTGQVINMENMFRGAFNQDIGNWNTAKVTDMGFMFRTASSFNQDVSSWNVTDYIQPSTRCNVFVHTQDDWDPACDTLAQSIIYRSPFSLRASVIVQIDL